MLCWTQTTVHLHRHWPAFSSAPCKALPNACFHTVRAMPGTLGDALEPGRLIRDDAGGRTYRATFQGARVTAKVFRLHALCLQCCTVHHMHQRS